MITNRQKVFCLIPLLLFALALYYTIEQRDSLNAELLNKIFSIQSEPVDKTLTKICGDGNFLRGPPEQDDPKVLEALRMKYLLPPSELPYNMTPEAENKKYYPGSNVSSFHFIDYYIKLLFNDQRSGFYIEAGALDGDIFSNSWYLEKELGWNGLLIEVDPYNYQHLVWKRRKAWASNTCIARVSYPQQPLFEFLKGQEGHGMPWVYRSNSRAVDSPFSKQNDGWTKSATITRFRMQCFPLASFLLALDMPTLDFLSLDIQGHEWDVLATIPHDKVKVRVMAIEYYYLSDKGILHLGVIDKDFVKFMEKSGYHLVDFDPESNYIFILKNDPLFEEKVNGKEIEKYYTLLNRLKAEKVAKAAKLSG